MKPTLSFLASAVSVAVAVAAALHHVMWASREKKEREGKEHFVLAQCIYMFVYSRHVWERPRRRRLWTLDK